MCSWNQDTTRAVIIWPGGGAPMLVVLDVTSATQVVAIGTEVHDIAGNRTTLYQVDIRPLSDPVICGGGRSSPGRAAVRRRAPTVTAPAHR